MNTIKKLTRPRNGRMLGGVCAGIGEYLGIDPTVVRIICVLLSIGTIGLALLVYLVIAVSQLRMRKILRAEGSEIRLRMWLYPWLTWLVIGFTTFVLVVMLFRPAQQLEVISTGLLAIGIICTVPIMARWKKLIMWQKTPIHNTR